MGEPAHIFTAGDVQDITGVTYAQIGYGRESGLIKPSIRPASGKGSGALYSLTDCYLMALWIEIGAKVGMTAQNTRTVLEFLRRPDALDVDRFPFLVVHEYDQEPTPMRGEEVAALFTEESSHPAWVVLNIRAVVLRVREGLAKLMEKRASWGPYGSLTDDD